MSTCENRVDLFACERTDLIYWLNSSIDVTFAEYFKLEYTSTKKKQNRMLWLE